MHDRRAQGEVHDYTVGLYRWVVEVTPEAIRYDVRLRALDVRLYGGRIDRQRITGIGLQDDRALMAAGPVDLSRLGTRDGQCGLLIAHREDRSRRGQRGRLASVVFDPGDAGQVAMVETLIDAHRDRYVGTAGRGELLSRLKVGKLAGNLLIAAMLLAIFGFAWLMTFHCGA